MALHKFKSFDLTGRFTWSIFSVLAVTFLITAVIVVTEERKALENLLTSSKSNIEEMLKSDLKQREKVEGEKAQRIASLLADIAPEAIAALDLTGLQRFAKTVIADEDYSFVSFHDVDGRVLVSAGEKTDGEATIKMPVKADELKIGEVMVAYNHRRMNKYINQAKDETNVRMGELTQYMDSTESSSVMRLIVIFTIITVIIAFLAYVLFERMVIRRLTGLEKRFNDIAEGDGDLRQRVNVSGSDAIDRLALNFNAFLEKIHSAMINVSGAVQDLSQSSDEVASVTEQTSRGVREQKSEVDQVATAMTEMLATVNEVAHNATSAAQKAKETDEIAASGRSVVAKSIESIDSLAHEVERASSVITSLQNDSNSIGMVLDVIRGIAEQTNLLALNAAIEAARAGDQGRGFAVVADEVRTLASRTQQSTQEIQQMIENLQSSAKNAVDTMDHGRQKAQDSVEQSAKAGTALEEITTSITTISEMSMQIASAVEEQNATVNSINANITNISQVAEDTAAGAQQTQKSSERLSQLSMNLQGIVSRFRV